MDVQRKTAGERERGSSWIEGLLTVAALGMAAVVAAGALNRIAGQSATRSLASEVKALVAEAATRAVCERTYVGVVFSDSENGVTARLYRDGDADGVKREDIRRGIDRPLGSARPLKQPWARVGIPPEVRTDPAGNPLPPDDPVRFGKGNTWSFSPTFTATPGTLYLRDAEGKEAWAFRAAGIDGRMRLYRWFKGTWTRWG
ncbi:MAG: hypothetical protein ACOYXN_13045 [Acidobacteriota bacterium]